MGSSMSSKEYLIRVVVVTKKTGRKMSYTYTSPIADITYHIKLSKKLHKRKRSDEITVSVREK